MLSLPMQNTPSCFYRVWLGTVRRWKYSHHFLNKHFRLSPSNQGNSSLGKGLNCYLVGNGLGKTRLTFRAGICAAISVITIVLDDGKYFSQSFVLNLTVFSNKGQGFGSKGSRAIRFHP
ncbi:hypothetical protein Nepgr_020548 [Nepenthes gracilis]|uniref:Uncharacterized protein n=1 Tax=Nepenthes gracilis TaxID=150966 RepID=A0AAD3SY83_NEPGR|nr:hypothetical protein Nepgr_020548 [Nepenthes gracilis]